MTTNTTRIRPYLTLSTGRCHPLSPSYLSDLIALLTNSLFSGPHLNSDRKVDDVYDLGGSTMLVFSVASVYIFFSIRTMIPS